MPSANGGASDESPPGEPASGVRCIERGTLDGAISIAPVGGWQSAGCHQARIEGAPPVWSSPNPRDGPARGLRGEPQEAQAHLSRELGPGADTSLYGLRVTLKLNRVIAEHGIPGTILSDSGYEFTSMPTI